MQVQELASSSTFFFKKTFIHNKDCAKTFVFPQKTFLPDYICNKNKRKSDCITVLSFIYICIYIQYTRKGDCDDVVIIHVRGVILSQYF